MKIKKLFIFLVFLILINNIIIECKDINHNQNKEDNHNNQNKENKEKDIIIDNSNNNNIYNNKDLLELVKELKKANNIVVNNKLDQPQQQSSSTQEEEELGNKKDKKEIDFNDIDLIEQFKILEQQHIVVDENGQLKFVIPNNKDGNTITTKDRKEDTHSSTTTTTTKTEPLSQKVIEKDQYDYLFDLVNGLSDNQYIKSDKELDGRDLLIEGQKYRGYLFYDRESSKISKLSNSIMTHSFDLGDDRDLFEFKGQSKLTPLNSTKAYELLEKSANQFNNHRAMYLLGLMEEIGEVTGIMNFTNAEKWYLKSANLGNSDSQRALGFLYSTGKLGYIDEAKATLYYSFSAKSGNIVAQMTMAYRYFYGHGVEKSCKKAAQLYEKVASRVASDYELRGFGYQIHSQRFSDERKKIHGYQDENDILDYLKYSSDDPHTMGQLYLEGSLVNQDFQQAYEYFKRAADMGMGAGYGGLGFMYNMGYGVEQNNRTAYQYYLKAAELNDRDAKSNLAEFYLYGYGVKQNTGKALEMFMEVAESRSSRKSDIPSYHASANLNLGKAYAYGIGGVMIDKPRASVFFSKAISAGDISSLYHLAKLHIENDESSCNMATLYFKKVAEKGPWSIVLSKAQELFEEYDYERSLLLSEKASEMGIEVSQFNSAWMYNKKYGLLNYFQDYLNNTIDNTNNNNLSNDDIKSMVPINENFTLDFFNQQSFKYYYYSSEQQNPLSHIKIGDFFYYGIGVEKSFESAAESYKIASAFNQPMAFYNLGYLYQYGEGVQQDFFLAKRYYDLSLTHQPKGYIPIYISLFILAFHYLFYLILSIFNSNYKIELTNQHTTTTTTTTTSNMDNLNNDQNNFASQYNFNFNEEFVKTIESYSILIFIIIIGYLVIRRQRIILNQQRVENNLNQPQQNLN